MTNDNDAGTTGPDKDQGAGEPKRVIGKLESWARGLLLIFAVPLTALVLMLPWSWTALQTIWAPKTVEPWGRVTSVRYVGGLAPKTQVSTADRTFLLSGAANLPKDALIEKQETFFYRQVCIAGTDHCWVQLGKWPQ